MKLEKAKKGIGVAGKKVQTRREVVMRRKDSLIVIFLYITCIVAVLGISGCISREVTADLSSFALTESDVPSGYEKVGEQHETSPYYSWNFPDILVLEKHTVEFKTTKSYVGLRYIGMGSIRCYLTKYESSGDAKKEFRAAFEGLYSDKRIPVPKIGDEAYGEVSSEILTGEIMSYTINFRYKNIIASVYYFGTDEYETSLDETIALARIVEGKLKGGGLLAATTEKTSTIPTITPDQSEVPIASVTDWPMFRHDLGRTGHIDESIPDDLELWWSYPTGGDERSSPTVANGRVFIGNNDKIYCLDEYNGKLIWTYETDDAIYSSPAVAGGKVFFGSYDHNFYCLDEKTGEMIWSYETEDSVCSAPAVAGGKVFFGSRFRDGRIYCMEGNTGQVIWSYETGEDIYSSPAVADGKVLAVSSEGKIYCLRDNDGKFLWSYEAKGSAEFSSSLAVANGKLFVCLYSYGRDVYCLDENNGKLIWSYETGDWIHSSPAVADGKVFAGSDEIFCLDENNGNLIWSSKTGAGMYSSPAVADGKVFVGNCCLDEYNGKLLWNYEKADTNNFQSPLGAIEASSNTTPTPLIVPGIQHTSWSSPAIANGKVFVSGEGKIYCFGAEEQPTLAVTPTFTPIEDAFNYHGEYTLELNELRDEESKVLLYAMNYAKEYKVSPCLIMAVIRQESNFKADANGGADVGYMQVTYDAAKYGSYKGTEQEWQEKDGLDPEQNIQYGTKYLMALNYIFSEGKVLIGDLKATKVPDTEERLEFVLAAYNGGAGRIATAQQICEEAGDDPEKWDEVKDYLEDAGATSEKAEIIKKYVEQVIEGRDFFDDQQRGYEFFLTIRVPVGGASIPGEGEKGVPGFEAVFAIAGLFAVTYLLKWKK